MRQDFFGFLGSSHAWRCAPSAWRCDQGVAERGFLPFLNPRLLVDALQQVTIVSGLMHKFLFRRLGSLELGSFLFNFLPTNHFSCSLFLLTFTTLRSDIVKIDRLLGMLRTEFVVLAPGGSGAIIRLLCLLTSTMSFFTAGTVVSRQCWGLRSHFAIFLDRINGQSSR